MNRGGWQKRPKRSTRRGKKEYMRSRTVAKTVARVKQMKLMHERSEEVRRSSDVSFRRQQ